MNMKGKVGRKNIKVTLLDANRIRNLYFGGKLDQKQLAKLYNVSIMYVSLIVRNLACKDPEYKRPIINKTKD